MAFTTIPGGDLADIILLGSEAADTVVLNTSQSIIANGFGGDDSITIANPVAATGGNTSDFTAPSTIYGGEGNDSLLLGAYTVGSSAILGGAGNDFFGISADRTAGFFDFQAAEVNGNEGEDTFAGIVTQEGARLGIRANGSQILGGANNDTIWVGTSSNTEFNGNKNLDRLNVVGNQTGGSVFGGKGIDFINTAFDGNVTYSGTSISGADGNDTITDTAVTVVANGTTLTVLGGQGEDVIELTLDGTGSALIGGGTEDDVITIAAFVDTTTEPETITFTTANLTIQGGEGADSITGFGTISGGEGADSIAVTRGARLLYALSNITTETGITTGTIDSITGAVAGGADLTTFKTGLAGTAANTAGFGGSNLATVGSDGFTAARIQANGIFLNNADIQFVLIDDTSAANAGSSFIFFKDSATFANATAAIQINDGDYVFSSIVA